MRHCRKQLDHSDSSSMLSLYYNVIGTKFYNTFAIFFESSKYCEHKITIISFFCLLATYLFDS